ncbi:MAG: protein kinase, partial [Deltaproteobacteria bacterium]|nr:protein kinase [Deltaproteobacteria bacterium]
MTTRTGSLEGKRFGNYIAFELLGQGGMGSVYLAEHPEIGRKVAIKVLAKNHSEEMVQRFLDEAKAVTWIGDPNIIDIYDFGRTGSGRLYFVMEWLDGRELRAVMNEKMPMNAFEVLPYVEQICAAIEAAHEQGIVHRDLKPANIFVLNQEPLKVKVLDFGVAKLLDTEQRSGITNPGILIGTPMFSAPEQAAAELDRICPQTDLYSLGVLLYWMLTGQPPFMSDNNSVLLAMHITDKPRPPREIMPSIPPAVAELLEQCLAKEPKDRPASARGLAAAWAAGLKRDDAKPNTKFDDGPSGVLVFLPETPVEEVVSEPTPDTDDRPAPVAGETDSGEDEVDDKPPPHKSVEVTERPTQGETPGTKLAEEDRPAKAEQPAKPRSDAEAIADFLASGEHPAAPEEKIKEQIKTSSSDEEPAIPAPKPSPGKAEIKTSLTPMSALNARKPAPALQPEPALITTPPILEDELPETQVEA